MEDKLHIVEGISITEGSQYYLTQTARWAKFLAIVGFIMSGLVAALGLGFSFFMSLFLESMSQTVPNSMGSMAGAGFIYVLISVIMFFPYLYLYRFSQKSKLAVETLDSDLMEEAMSQLSSLYKFKGILTIIVIGFYLVIFLFAGIGFAAFSSFQ